MNRRRKIDYVCVLKAIQKEGLKHQINLDPQTIMVDFEKAAINAFKEVFKKSEIKGCLFHFCQSLYKKLCSLGFQDLYNKDEAVQTWFKSIFCLSLVPLEEVHTVWCAILSERLMCDKLSNKSKHR